MAPILHRLPASVTLATFDLWSHSHLISIKTTILTPSSVDICYFVTSPSLPLTIIFPPCPSSKWIQTIDIESLQNRLLRVCYEHATSARLPRLLLLRPLTVLIKQTRQAVRAIKQSMLPRCLWFEPSKLPSRVKWCTTNLRQQTTRATNLISFK